MSISRFFRGAVVSTCAIALVLLTLSLVAAPHALAAGAVSTTTTEHQGTDTFTDVVPCGADPNALYDITLTYNEIDHVTTGPNSIHFTMTQTGTFVAVPQDPSLPTYTGHFMIWDGDNDNAQTASGTFTFDLHGTGSDGSTITFNAVEHFNVDANGVQHHFDFENCH
jgi:hypothetical protein